MTSDSQRESYTAARLMRSPMILGTIASTVLQLTMPRSPLTRVVSIASNLWIANIMIRRLVRGWRG